MSIFEAMERLAGAALLALAPALKVAVPTRQRGRGMDLVQMLRQRGAAFMEDIEGWIAEHDRPGAPDKVRAGVMLHMFVDEESGSEVKPAGPRSV